jgi:hypothetical protein
VFDRSEIDGLDHIGVCTQLVGVIDIGWIIGGGDNDNRDTPEERVLLDPLQDLKAVFARHLDIHDHKLWEVIGYPIRVFSFSAKIIDSVLAIGYDLQRVLDASHLESTLDEENVIQIVLNQQHGELFCVHNLRDEPSPVLGNLTASGKNASDRILKSNWAINRLVPDVSSADCCG